MGEQLQADYTNPDRQIVWSNERQLLSNFPHHKWDKFHKWILYPEINFCPNIRWDQEMQYGIRIVSAEMAQMIIVVK